MVKASRQQADAALTDLSPDWRAVLLYGPDDGLVRERAERLGRQICTDLSDPFRVARLTPERLKAEPALLADEMAAIAMTGGRRLVRLDAAADLHAAAIGEVIARDGDALLLVTAGDLPPRSKLRRLFETDKKVLAIPCYADDDRALAALVRQVLGEAGLHPSPDALAWLCAELGGDRQLSRRELEKLVLYKEGDAERAVSLEDARAVVGDAAATTLAALAEAVTGGEVARADRLLEKAFIAGESPVAVLRVLARRLRQLHLVRGHMTQGLDAREAADRLVPRLFFKERDAFLRHVGRWSAGRAAAALERLAEAEADCKTTGLPAETVCARACLALAAAARGAGPAG